MIDEFLNVGSALDWITPTLAFIQDLFFGPFGDFGIPANPVWGRKEIKRLLRYHGIRVWGLMYNYPGDVLMFTVRKQQAELTYYLLRMVGVPVLYGPDEVINSFSQPALINFDTYPNDLVYDSSEDLDIECGF